MNASQFARHLGVSAPAVAKALSAGRLDSVVRWETRGSRRVATITDVPGAVKLWLSRPGARAPALAQSLLARSEPPSATSPAATSDVLDSVVESRRQLERFKAKREELEYEVRAGRLIEVDQAMQIFGRQIAEAKTAVMGVGRHARSRIPHLTIDDVATIEALCRDALEGLAAGSIQQPERREGKVA